MQAKEPGDLHERLVAAYDHMLDHARSALERARGDGLPKLQHLLDAARDQVVAIGKITHEEADEVAAYVRRDLVHAAEYLETSGRDLTDWLKFDIALLEQGGAHVFEQMVDHTRETLDDLALRADAIGWKTGEIVGPGTLHCKNCRQLMHFHKTGHIPPCPRCKHTAFAREHEIE